jgi:hypothetical protein
MRSTFVHLLAAAILVTVIPGSVATAYESYYGDSACEGDGGCYDDGGCYGADGCYDDGCYGADGCHGHGGGLFHRHGAGGHKCCCYWLGGCCCGNSCGGGSCCYNCFGVGDSGYMLPIRRAQWYNWNRNYAYTDYGVPTALVVPPTANLQTNYGWGVASSRMSRIDHQFQRNYPGGGIGGIGGVAFGGPFRPTPVWPSDTTQFGVYYVRGPW